VTAIVRIGPELVLRLAYDARRFDDAGIRQLLAHWQTLLGGIAADPDQRLRDVTVLTEDESRTLLLAWHRTHAEDPHSKRVHQMFETQAARTPDAIAVVYDARQLTYRELDRWANRLAHALRQADVGPEVRVAICLERSLDMMVAVLAVLKAGGTYVPLDPAYPKERQSLLLRDSGARIL